MGLKLTLPKEDNGLYHDFIDAYWVIEDLRYEMKEEGLFAVYWLNCYPSRDSFKKIGLPVSNIGIGHSEMVIYNGKLYEYLGLELVSNLFPNGIPVDINEQKTVIYNYIKANIDLPFEDVFEN